MEALSVVMISLDKVNRAGPPNAWVEASHHGQETHRASERIGAMDKVDSKTNARNSNLYGFDNQLIISAV
jgi:hypothetical protein